MSGCVFLICEQVGQGERGVMKTEGEKVSDFPSSSVLSPRSSAVAKCQLDIGLLSLALTQTDTQNHRYTSTDVCSHYNLKSLWKTPKE